MITDEWEATTGRPAPPLVRAFAADPDAALDALLTGAAGTTLARRGAAGVLATWLSWLSSKSGFARTVDAAVARRIAVEWESPNELASAGRRRALRLVRLFDIVSTTPGKLFDAPAELRARFATRGDALAPWSPGPSQDPLGRYLLALARTQPDRARAPFWFAHCRLPASVPLFRAEYGIAGLRGLPPDEPRDDEFPYEVASGLRVLADGIQRGVVDGRFDVADGTRTFVSIGKLCIAAYPFSGWSDELLVDADASDTLTAQLLREIAALDQRAATAETLRRMFAAAIEHRPPAPSSQPRSRRAPGHREPAVAETRVRRLLAAVTRGEEGSVARVQAIIDTEGARATRSGDAASEIGRLLRRASSAARNRFPEAAVKWAEAGLQWDPWDVRSWTVVTAAYRTAGRAAEGLDKAWRAHAQFPYNPYVWAELGQLLAEDNRIGAAEAVLTEAIKHFPDNAISVSAYGEMLIATGRAAEAVPLLEEAVTRFESVAATVPMLWSGLVSALIGSGRVPEAKQIAIKGYRLMPDDPLAEKLATRFERFQAERMRRDAAYVDAGPHAPADDGTLFSVTSEARVLRQRARSIGTRAPLDEAWAILERNSERGSEHPQFVAEAALVRAERGEAEQALDIAGTTGFRDSADVSVAVALTRVKRLALLASSAPEARSYTVTRMAELTAEMRAVAHSNSAVRPLNLLTRLQFSAALTDGAAVTTEREHAYRDMIGWIGRAGAWTNGDRIGRDDEELIFTRQWSNALAGVWAGMSAAPRGDDIADRTSQESDALDGLQETFEHRLSALS